MRIVRRDPDRAHQVVLTTNPAMIAGHPTVSCNCRWDGRKYDPIGVAEDFAATMRLYNNPENHRKPFAKEDELDGERSKGIRQGTTQTTAD